MHKICGNAGHAYRLCAARALSRLDCKSVLFRAYHFSEPSDYFLERARHALSLCLFDEFIDENALRPAAHTAPVAVYSEARASRRYIFDTCLYIAALATPEIASPIKQTVVAHVQAREWIFPRSRFPGIYWPFRCNF